MERNSLGRVQTIERVVFWISVAAGLSAAIAGGYGWTKTAIATGCLAAFAPIVSRVITARERAALLAQLADRILTEQQAANLISVLKQGEPFDVWICCNRHEVEPARFHGEITAAFRSAGFEPKFFGGMTNATVGIEVAGNATEEKGRILAALSSARIPHVNVEFSDDPNGHWGPSIWIGVKPPPHL